MRTVELNQRGNFETWDVERLTEIRKNKFNDALGHFLLFESSHVKLWEIILLPKERLTFRHQKHPYVWVCETGGLAISRYISGQIFLSHFDKDDTAYFEPDEDSFVRDFENIGDDVLKMTVVEFTKKNEMVKMYSKYTP